MKQCWVSAGEFFTSVKMAIYLTGMLAVYIFVAGVWSSGELQDNGPLTYVIAGISEGIAGRVLYTLFLLNLFFLIVKRVIKFVRQFSHGVMPISPAEIHTLPDHAVLDAEGFPPGLFERIHAALTEKGYHIQVGPGGGIYAVKGRLSALGKLILALSLFLLLFGVFISFNSRVAREIIAGEGESVYLDEQAGVSRYTWTSGRREIKLQERGNFSGFSFRLNRVYTGQESGSSRPWYSFLAGDITAWITYPVLSPENEATIPFYPPQRLMGKYLQLSDFGYAPFVLIKDEQGKVVERSFMILRLLPAGREDFFQPPGSVYKFYVSLVPKSGQESGKDFSVPDYFLKITRGEQIIYRGKVTPGQDMYFEGKTVSFSETRYWAGFNVISDDGLPIVFTGIILGVIGLVSTVLCKIICYRRELFVVPVEEAAGTKIYAGARAERASKAHAGQFHCLLEEITGFSGV